MRWHLQKIVFLSAVGINHAGITIASTSYAIVIHDTDIKLFHHRYWMPIDTKRFNIARICKQKWY